jgi:hypothetical protein
MASAGMYRVRPGAAPRSEILLLAIAANMIALAAGAARAKPAFAALLLAGAVRFALSGLCQAVPVTGAMTERIADWIACR